MTKESYPPGRYQCPKCSGEVEVYVSMTQPPLHRCGVGNRKINVMTFVSEVKGATRNRVRGLDAPEQGS